jgi:hypothetical protein
MGLFLKNQQLDLQCITNYVIVNLIQNPPINEGMLNQVQHDAVYVKPNTITSMLQGTNA